MKLKQQHGRIGQAQEFYEWTIVKPRVVVQRVGGRWLLGIKHTDGTWHVPAYLDTEADAKTQGRRLAQLYATAEHSAVQDDVKMAIDFVENLFDARKGKGVWPIIDASDARDAEEEAPPPMDDSDGSFF